MSNEKIDYAFEVGDFVEHKKYESFKGVVVHVHRDPELGGLTFCTVVWNVNGLAEALCVPKEHHAIVWTNNIYLVNK